MMDEWYYVYVIGNMASSESSNCSMIASLESDSSIGPVLPADPVVPAKLDP